MSKIKSLRFVSPGRSWPTSRHPLTGLSFTVHKANVYDLTTGAPVTREGLLSDLFHFPGDINHMPIEVLKLASARTASVEISWEGMTMDVPGAADGFSYDEDNDDLDDPAESPSDGSDNVRVYYPGNSVIGSPDGTHSHDSVFTRGQPRGAFSATEKLRALTRKAGFSGRATKTFIEPTEESFFADTGIPIPSGEEGETFQLDYTLNSGKTGLLTWGVGGAPVFYSEHDVWGAPVFTLTETTEYLDYVSANREPDFISGPPGSFPSEWVDIVTALADSLEEDNNEKRIQEAGAPVGLARFVVYPSGPPDLDFTKPAPSVSILIASQLPRFLPFERLGSPVI